MIFPDAYTAANTAAFPEAVLLDMDGTLVDSEGLWLEAECEEFARFGLDWTAENQNIMIGMMISDGVQTVFDTFKIDADAYEVGERIAARMLSLVKERGVDWRPGAYEFLERLVEWRIPVALVTSSKRSYAQLIADRAPEGSVTAMVTGDMVTRGKPHPEPFLRGAAELGVDPALCVAFEDSRAGLLSARDSGAITVAVPFQDEIPKCSDIVILDSLEHADAGWFTQLMHSERGITPVQ